MTIPNSLLSLKIQLEKNIQELESNKTLNQPEYNSLKDAHSYLILFLEKKQYTGSPIKKSA